VPCLGITGGIATGKSSFVKAVSPLFPAEVFDADRCSRELLTHDPQVQLEVRQYFGGHVFTAEGSVDRVKLRELVFSDCSGRKALEAILHPRIRERWTSLALTAKASTDWLIVDIPLLFETRVEDYFNSIIVVACSARNQIERLIQTRKLDTEIASQMMASQLELRVKMQQAGHVIWNDGSISCMEQQAVLAADYFKKVPWMK